MMQECTWTPAECISLTTKWTQPTTKLLETKQKKNAISCDSGAVGRTHKYMQFIIMKDWCRTVQVVGSWFMENWLSMAQKWNLHIQGQASFTYCTPCWGQMGSSWPCACLMWASESHLCWLLHGNRMLDWCSQTLCPELLFDCLPSPLISGFSLSWERKNQLGRHFKVIRWVSKSKLNLSQETCSRLG